MRRGGGLSPRRRISGWPFRPWRVHSGKPRPGAWALVRSARWACGVSPGWQPGATVGLAGQPTTRRTRSSERGGKNSERGARNSERGWKNAELGAKNGERGTGSEDLGTRSSAPGSDLGCLDNSRFTRLHDHKTRLNDFGSLRQQPHRTRLRKSSGRGENVLFVGDHLRRVGNGGADGGAGGLRIGAPLQAGGLDILTVGCPPPGRVGTRPSPVYPADGRHDARALPPALGRRRRSRSPRGVAARMPIG